jgi:hypothetical protein
MVTRIILILGIISTMASCQVLRDKLELERALLEYRLSEDEFNRRFHDELLDFEKYQTP